MRKFRLNLWGPSSDEKEKAGQESVVVNGEVPGVGGGKFYGIKSYLNSFYLSPAIEEIETGGQAQGNTWYLLPPPPAQRAGLYACRVLTVLGLCMLLAGAAVICVAYSGGLPRMLGGRQRDFEGELTRIAIDQDAEGNFYVLPERLTELLADPWHQWKITGFCVFAAGASLMALSLLVPMLAQCCGGTRLAAFASGDCTPNEAPVRVYPGAAPSGSRFRVVPAKFSGSHKISPTNASPVPVMEEISKVQPPGSKSASKAVSPADGAEQLLLDQLVDSSDAQPLIR